MANYRRSQQESFHSKTEAVEIPTCPLLDDDGKPVLKEDGTPDCSYFVRSMSMGERESFDAAVLHKVGDEMLADYSKIRSELLVRTLSDQDGTRLYADAEVNLIRNNLEGDVWLPAFLKAQGINGMDRPAKNS